jgi:hypothetical protein
MGVAIGRHVSQCRNKGVFVAEFLPSGKVLIFEES